MHACREDVNAHGPWRGPGLADGQKPAPYQVRGDVICRIERMDRILGVSLPSNGPNPANPSNPGNPAADILPPEGGCGLGVSGFWLLWVLGCGLEGRIFRQGRTCQPARGGFGNPPGADLPACQGRIWQPARGGLSALRCQHTAGWGTQLFFPTFSCTQYAKGAPARGHGQSRWSSRQSW